MARTKGRDARQFWTLTPVGKGKYRLTNASRGVGKSLDVSRNRKKLVLRNTGNYSGQFWTLTKLSKTSDIAALPQPPKTAEAVPVLDPKGSVYKTEGPTDYGIYLKARGTLKAVMLFVDFPNAPGGSSKTSDIAKNLLGDGKAQLLFKRQSYGQMRLRVTQIKGWRRMPKNAGHYTDAWGNFSFEQHKTYLKDVAVLFPDVTFSAYDMVFVVASKTDEIALSPAFNAYPGQGVDTGRGEIRLAVTAGNDSYSNRYTNIVHEIGHLLGLPDLYRYSDGNLTAGPWALMSDIFKGTSFLGWHRHKLGWLNQNRKIFLRSGTLRTTLSPLSANRGTSLIVVPVDSAEKPSKVFVVEVAEPVLGANGKLWGDGILIYSVDATIATGEDPVIIYPAKPGDSPIYGKLYRAPFGAGHGFENANAPMKLSVLKKVGKGYNVIVTVK